MIVANVVGARPNLMKIAPLVDAMRARDGFEPVLIHTGQHYDERMSRLFFDELGIPSPDHYLGVGSDTQARQTARAMLELEPLFAELKPDLVLVVGDVNSTLAAAVVASKLGLRLAHVEAGLRSFDRRMPEEINRVLTDAIADLLFTTEPSARENLLREGVAEERIHFVGNVMIDTLVRHRERARTLGAPERHGVRAGEYAVLTLHRPSNVDDPEALDALLGALDRIQRRLPVLFPMHPRTRRRVGEFGFEDRVRAMHGMRVLEPLGYLEFLGLLADARIVLTDSGGIQEETTILGVPCLTLRENTERPVTIDVGTNRLVGRSTRRIVEEAERVLDAGGSRPASRPEGWDGRAAERIVDVLADRREAGRP